MILITVQLGLNNKVSAQKLINFLFVACTTIEGDINRIEWIFLSFVIKDYFQTYCFDRFYCYGYTHSQIRLILKQCKNNRKMVQNLFTTIKFIFVQVTGTSFSILSDRFQVFLTFLQHQKRQWGYKLAQHFMLATVQCKNSMYFVQCRYVQLYTVQHTEIFNPKQQENLYVR